jgi:hypothetical protein
MRANQLRLWFASMAYVLLSALRRIGLRFAQFASASCGSIWLKLLEIGAATLSCGPQTTKMPHRTSHQCPSR